MRGWGSATGLALVGLGLLAAPAPGEEAAIPLARGVRGLVTRAPARVVVDGSLREWENAFCTPVQYNHRDPDNRAGQFFYLWDDEALYVGLRCLDRKQSNPAELKALYDGDGVEFYLDTRPGAELRGKDWSEGAIHFFFSPFEGRDLRPRWVMRQGIATSATVLKGVEVRGTRTDASFEVEFKLPWANFPRFKAAEGAVLALDAELCYGDGGRRIDRTFAYGSPLSVTQPASLGKVQLVKTFDPEYFEAVGPAAFPFWVETPWNQPERGAVRAVVAVPPAFVPIVGLVEVRIHDTDGKVVKTIPARVEPFGPEGLGFARAEARWSVDDYAPGSYLATARITARTGKTIATVAPRMVQEAMISGR
jgi:hypothetical protein